MLLSLPKGNRLSDLHPISGCEDARRKADVIFVHGLGGDAFGTWRHGEDETTSWPHWLGEEFPEIGVWSVGYAASPSKWARWKPGAGRDAGQGTALPTRAKQLLDQMSLEGLGRRPTLFIGHSLGGLVIKQLLRISSDSKEARLGRFVGNTRAVLFLATPHHGAGVASLVDWFRRLVRSTDTMEGLRAGDAYLLDLHDWYRNHAALANIRTATYYEEYTVGLLRVVNSASSYTGVGESPVGLDENHISIAKPRDKDAQVCGAARRLLWDWVLRPQPVLERKEESSGTVREKTGPIFMLPPAAMEFVGRRSEVAELEARLRAGKNTAVVGAAGMGKTAIAAEALGRVMGARGEFLPTSRYPDGVIYLDLYALHGVKETAWKTLADRTSGADFLPTLAAQERAKEAFDGRKVLLVVEGGEEANGEDGRLRVEDLWEVLGRESGWLLLTRAKTQAHPVETVEVKEALGPEDAGHLFDVLSREKAGAAVRDRALKLLAGHPLALTWAATLIGQEVEDAEVLVSDWESGRLPRLSDPARAGRTLEWLFERSSRTLPGGAKRALEAAGLLASTGFPAAALLRVLKDTCGAEPGAARGMIRLLVERSLLRRMAEDHLQFTHVLGYQFARKETGADPQVLESLGRWVYEGLAKELAVGTEQNAVVVDRLSGHLGALLRADVQQLLWFPLANRALYDFQDRLSTLGRLGQAKVLVAEVGNWMNMMKPEEATRPIWRRERAAMLSFMGEMQLQSGDTMGSLESAQASLETIRALAESEPLNLGWRRDLSIGHEKVGDVQLARGDSDGAFHSYFESLDIIRLLLVSDPTSKGLREHLSISYAKIGSVEVAQGRIEAALLSYSTSLELINVLRNSEPSDSRLMQLVGVSLINVGDIQRAKGDASAALSSYNSALEHRIALVAIDPSNAIWRRELGTSYQRVGNCQLDIGDFLGALDSYRASLRLSVELVTSDPVNIGWQRDLSIGHEKVGNAQLVQGDPDGAQCSYQLALDVIRPIADADQSNAGWQRHLSVSHEKVGDAQLVRGDAVGALSSYRTSIELRSSLVEADPSNAEWRRILSVSHKKVGIAQLALMDTAGALASYLLALKIMRMLAASDPSNAAWQWDLSQCLLGVAECYARSAGPKDALPAGEEGLAILEGLVLLDPMNGFWRADLASREEFVLRLRAASAT